MIKYLILFLFYVQIFSLLPQENKIEKLTCRDIDSILNNKIVFEHLQLYLIHDSITIVDTYNIINCNELKFKGIDVLFNKKYINKISKGPRSYNSLKKIKNRYIVVTSLKRRNEILFLRIWQPNDNAFIEIRLSKNEKMLNIEFGDLGVF
jgi:hypothetical protein